MIEYTEHHFCEQCDRTAMGFTPGCRWAYCPLCGTALVSEADLDAAHNQDLADAMADERFMADPFETIRTGIFFGLEPLV